MIRDLSTLTLAICIAGCSKPPAKKTEAPADPALPPLRIAQFYAATPHIGKGDRAALCYGVEGAKDLRLSPAVESVWPSQSRCFEVKPAATTTYTLIAEDSAGHTVSEKATIEVGPASNARLDKPAGVRMIKEVTVSQTEIARGQQVTICYTAANAASVTIKPGEGGALSPARGCVVDKPLKTTVYEVRATGAGGQNDMERVAVKVR